MEGERAVSNNEETVGEEMIRIQSGGIDRLIQHPTRSDRRCSDARTQAFARDDPLDVSRFLIVQNNDWDIVFEAMMDRLSVHNLQVLAKHVLIRNLRIPHGMRVLQRVVGIHSVYTSRLHQQVRIDFSSTKSGRGIGRDERASGPCCKDHNPTLFEMANTPSTNKGFGNRRDRNRTLDSGWNPVMLHDILQCQGIDRRSEHPHVVSSGWHNDRIGRGEFLTPQDIPPTTNDGKLNPAIDDSLNLFADDLHFGKADSGFAGAGEAFSAELKQNPSIFGGRP
jgi:hypothetical protein